MDNAQTFKSPSSTDVEVMARTIYGEARGESLAGQVQVAFCIIKRAQNAAAYVARTGHVHVHYGDGSLTAVCKAPRQFDCWDVGDNNYAATNSVYLGEAAYRLAMYSALAALHWQEPNRFPDATHYYNPDVAPKTPTWVTGVPASPGHAAIPPALFEGSIGHHRFYSAVPA